jgi:hypothetical protein
MLFWVNRKSTAEAVGCQLRQSAVSKWGGAGGEKGLPGLCAPDILKNCDTVGGV